MTADARQPQIYAHRGASEQYAEHTRAAYLQALAEGADGVECDIRLTADGQVVLLHDATLDRTSDGTAPVAERTLAQLRDLDFSSWKGADIPLEYGADSEQLLTLDELLDILESAGRPLGLAIEFKHPLGIMPHGTELEQRTLDILGARGWKPQRSRLGQIRVSFMSFEAASLSFMLSRVPAEHLCQLVEAVNAEQIRDEWGTGPLATAAAAAALRWSRAAGERLLDAGDAGLAGPGVDYLRNYPQRCRQWANQGRHFRVWTVDTQEQLAVCLDFGVQEVTTNRPAGIRRLLVAQG